MGCHWFSIQKLAPAASGLPQGSPLGEYGEALDLFNDA